ncbi:MAG: NifB/NifX family molybdenum-iron cluster-binding protein [Anaerolineae bacterium]|nr:NifB/NifX family molybdenum-iron cluster-binding protein [Anaerolineae bacterium]
MKIVISANGVDLDAPTSPVFGRCPTYVFVDIADDGALTVEAVENSSIAAAGGAGIQAAQFVIERGAQAVITGNMGPNAFNVCQSAGVPTYLFVGGTVRDAVAAFQAGQLQSAADANVQAHAGMGAGRGMGMGRGMGRGMGMGRRVAAAPPAAPAPAQPAAAQEEIDSLKGIAGELRQQLAELMARLDQLENKE